MKCYHRSLPTISKKLGADEFLDRYRLSKDDAREYLGLTKEKYPRKFI